MNSPESPAAILREHLEICAELHAVLLEENRVMRTTGALPGDDLLNRKREFLPRLDASLERLRRLNEAAPGFSHEEEAAVQEGRKKLMQLLMLDRENERMLLKASLPASLKATLSPVAPGQVARAYQRFAPPPKRAGGAQQPQL